MNELQVFLLYFIFMSYLCMQYIGILGLLHDDYYKSVKHLIFELTPGVAPLVWGWILIKNTYKKVKELE